MKTLITGLFMAVLFSSCDPNADKQLGRAGRNGNVNPNNGNGGGGAGVGVGAGGTTNSTTDAPIDGGICVLLAAGAAYGVKRYRNAKQKA
jgi:hypothetical protein